jgi:hypothetical protein
MGFVVDKAALLQVLSEYFYIPCPSFYRLLHTHHPSSAAGTIVKIMASVPSGLSLNPPQETKKKLSIINLSRINPFIKMTSLL